MMSRVIGLFALCAILFSCSTQHVVTEHAIQKRKYRPGLFVSKKERKSDAVRLAVAHEEPVAETPAENYPTPLPEMATTDQEKMVVVEGKTLNRQTKKRDKVAVDPLQKSKEIVAKFVPMQSADAFFDRIGRITMKRDIIEGTSDSAVIGCVIGGAAVGSLLLGAATVDYGFGFYLMILAFALSIAGLVFSIRGAVESSKKDIKGKILSIIGIVSNGVVAIIGIFAILLILFIIALFSTWN